MPADNRRMKQQAYHAPRVVGNLALRQEAAAPELRPDIEDEARRRKAEIEKHVMANRLQTRVYSRAQVLIMAAALTLVLAIGAFYLLQLSSYRANRLRVSSLEKQYEELKKDNALLTNICESYIDYEGILEYARSAGMSAPGKQQIVTYQRSNTEYVEKGGEIPNE